MIELYLGKKYRVIRTENGQGMTAYKEWDKAPAGERWPWKLKEGSVIILTRFPNDRDYVEGLWEGKIVVIDGEGHLEEVQPEQKPGSAWETVLETEFLGRRWRLQRAIQSA